MVFCKGGERKMTKHDSISRRIFCVCNVIFFILLMAVVLFPYLHILAKAFNDGKDTSMGGITIFPRVFTLENFSAVIGDDAFGRAFVVTVCIVLVGTLVSLLIQFMTAYVFTNNQFIGHKFLMYMFMIPMYFGGGLIPHYILYSKIGMLNNYLVYILPTCFSVYNMIIIRSYLNTIPPSLAESAEVDGANHLTVAFRIILPLAKPVLATVALWLAVGLWNNWTTTLYYVTKKDMYTLQYVLMQVLKEAEKIQALIKDAALRGEVLEIETNITTDSVRSAQLIVTTVPIVIIYPFLQKYFIQGITLGAVKD